MGHRQAFSGANYNGDALVADGTKRILIRLIVADVHRQGPAAISVQYFHQRKKSLALVPIDVRPELKNLLSPRLFQLRIVGKYFIEPLLQLRQYGSVYLAIVDGDGKTLALDSGTRYVLDGMQQLCLGAIESGQKAYALLLIPVSPLPADIKAVATGIGDTLNANHTPHIFQIAAADDG